MVTKEENKHLEKNGVLIISRMDNQEKCRRHMAEHNIPFSGSLVADGKIHRFSTDSKKNQPDEWYVAYEGVSQRGNDYLCCVYGTWSKGGEKFTFNSWEDDEGCGQEERAELEMIRKQKQAEAAQLHEKDRQERLQKARDGWARAKDTSAKPAQYLVRKKVQAYGLKYGEGKEGDELVVIPLRNLQGEIRAIQTIRGDGEKRIYGLKKGHFHVLGEITANCKIFFAEGYATAASIHEATKAPVVVTFDCGNIDAVVAAFREKYPSHTFTIAADDDAETPGNPGKAKAEAAARKYDCKVLLPKFPPALCLVDGKRPSDFNDVHVLMGLEEARKQLQGTRLSPVMLNDFLERVLPERKYLLSPWLREKGLAMIYSERGVGKTQVALTVAWAIGTGGSLGSWEAPIPRRVLYVDGEMPADAMQERLAGIAKGSVSDLLDQSYFQLITPDLQGNGMPNLGTLEGQQAINELMGDFDVVILDNISTLVYGGEENSADSWSIMQQWALRLRKEGKSVIFIHHAGKKGLQRGTSRREDILDTVIALRRPKAYSPTEGARFEVHFEKSRGFTGGAAAPCEMKLDVDQNGAFSWSVKPVAGDKYKEMVDLKEEGYSQKEIAEMLGVSTATVSRQLHKKGSGCAA